jgi:hypothetical protein
MSNQQILNTSQSDPLCLPITHETRNITIHFSHSSITTTFKPKPPQEAVLGVGEHTGEKKKIASEESPWGRTVHADNILNSISKVNCETL